jgi:hypothetical protein
MDAASCIHNTCEGMSSIAAHTSAGDASILTRTRIDVTGAS